MLDDEANYSQKEVKCMLLAAPTLAKPLKRYTAPSEKRAKIGRHAAETSFIVAIFCDVIGI